MPHTPIDQAAPLDGLDRFVIRLRSCLDRRLVQIDRMNGCVDFVAANLSVVAIVSALKYASALKAVAGKDAPISEGPFWAIFFVLLMQGIFLAVRWPFPLWTVASALAGLGVAVAVASTATVVVPDPGFVMAVGLSERVAFLNASAIAYFLPAFLSGVLQAYRVGGRPPSGRAWRRLIIQAVFGLALAAAIGWVVLIVAFQ